MPLPQTILDSQQPEDMAMKADKFKEQAQVCPPPKPFPYYPPIAPEEERKRTEVMMELNKWANNDPFLAKRAAETLILLLSDQFDINLIQL